MGNNKQTKDELKSLDQIFVQGKRVFRIPDYQRGYSWEKQQRDDLLADVEYLIKARYEYRHYTGTIVASLNRKETEEVTDGYEVFDVVDGPATDDIFGIASVCNMQIVKEIRSSESIRAYRDFLQIYPGRTGRKYGT